MNIASQKKNQRTATKNTYHPRYNSTPTAIAIYINTTNITSTKDKDDTSDKNTEQLSLSSLSQSIV